jgi:colanic acid biosynthesis glycosyl transferase WcaI
MGVKQQLENVLGAAKCLRAHSEIVFLLVGGGSQKNALTEIAARENLSNVRFAPLLPRERLPELMAAADILLLNQHPDLVEAVIPSKLLTYMAAGRPIVVAAHPVSEAVRLVREAECGVCVAPDAPDALADAIVALTRDAASRAALSARGRAYVQRHFAREVALQRFESALVNCLE